MEVNGQRVENLEKLRKSKKGDQYMLFKTFYPEIKKKGDIMGEKMFNIVLRGSHYPLPLCVYIHFSPARN